jgi:L-amino acid N-acyltransferase YncA
MAATIRLATESDAEQIQAIYAPYVIHTAISFELEPPTVEEMRRRIGDILPHWPWLVCEQRRKILGYVYAGRHRSRAAYQWSADVSVYIDEQFHRLGIGRALYGSLFAILALQGFYNAYAGITLPNAASVSLHESLGFQPIGVYRAVGYKFGAWHDVGWWQLMLQTRTIPPNPPKDLRVARASPEWEAVLATGLPLLRLESLSKSQKL